MPEQPKINWRTPKLYFFYFLVFTIIVLIIFSYIIGGAFWKYWAQNKSIEEYYRQRALELTQIVPQIYPNDPLKGEVGAKATVIVYSDFTCPACQDFTPDLQSLEKLYGNQVQFVFKGLPLSGLPESRPALVAAYCANEQNKFWEYHDLLFSDPTALNQQKYREYANTLGLDLTSFNQCLSNKKYDSMLTRNLSDALSLQIDSIPSVYINGQKIEGFLNIETLKNLINQKLK